MKKYSIILLCALGLTTFSGCEEALEVDPTTSIGAEDAVVDFITLERASLGAYSALQTTNYYGLRYLLYQDLYADNLMFAGTFSTDREVANRVINPTNLQIASTWGAIYTVINRANIVIREAEQLDNISADEREYIQGQMYFLRALAHFDLARVFGGVPVITEPTTTIEEITYDARATEEQVYDAVINDLEAAEAALEGFDLAPELASASAARALLARVHLQRGNNAEAAAYADQVIEEGSFGLEENFSDIFENEGNSEIIFEVDFTLNDQSGLGSASDPSTPGQRFYLNAEAYNALLASDTLAQDVGDYSDERFEATTTVQGNRRRLTKYSDVVNNADDVPVIRLAEMYLIRAEANARMAGASAPASEQVVADINAIRTRAGLPAIEDGLTNEEALEEILEQRRLEFIGEGLRFLDLRRYDLTCEELGFCEEDGNAYRSLWPIPLQQIEVNPNLTQNPGY